MAEVRIEVPNWKVVRVEVDTESGIATLFKSDGTTIECYLTEFSWGAQGTWIKAVPINDHSYAICIGQSGTMPSVTYLVHEPQVVPEEPLPISPKAPSEVVV